MNWKNDHKTIFFSLLLGGLSFFPGCGLFGDSGYIPQEPQKAELPKFDHPMNVPWEGKRDVYFERYADYMTERERKVYLETPTPQRWDLFHDKFIVYQELESLLEFSNTKLSPTSLVKYYQSGSLKEGALFLEKNGFQNKKNNLEGEKK